MPKKSSQPKSMKLRVKSLQHSPTNQMILKSMKDIKMTQKSKKELEFLIGYNESEDLLDDRHVPEGRRHEAHL